jgi:hypothetical protein
MQSLIRESIMHNAGSSESAYASAALMLGLLDVLANKGILSRDDLNTVIVDAISKLEPGRNIGSMNGAIELIKSLSSEIHGSN